MKKRMFMSAFLALTMIVSMFSMTAFAASAESATDISQPEIVGKVITVDSPEELRWVSAYSYGNAPAVDGISEKFTGCTINIVGTIDLENVAWTPIKNFHGTMKGVPTNNAEYAVITRLNVTDATDGAGLCGNVSYTESGNPTFTDIMISESTIETAATSSYAGAFIANGYVANFTHCRVYNTSVKGYRFVGGICGVTYGNITSCTVDSNKNSTIEAYGNGDTDVASAVGDNAGGIVGQIGEGGSKINNCKVDGVKVIANRQVGGIAGLALYGNTIEHCEVYNTTVEAKAAYNWLIALGGRSPSAGGICGQTQTNSSATIKFEENTVDNTVNIHGVNGDTHTCGWILGSSRGTTYQMISNHYPSTGLPQVG